MANHFNVDNKTWDATKAEITNVLIEYAQNESTLSYSELTAKVVTIELDPMSSILKTLLCEISEFEDGQGRGMLSVLVTKTGSTEPGEGFFELARKLGRDVSNRELFLITESNAVFNYWSAKPRVGNL